MQKENLSSQIVVEPLIDDSATLDFQISWRNPEGQKKGSCKIFTYGQERTIAIAIFRMMYPGYKIDRTVCLR